MELFVKLRFSPDEITTIENIVRHNDCFITHMTEDVYSIRNYVLRLEYLDIYALLDRNFYTRIAALIEGIVPTPSNIEDYRWASAVLAFCQIAHINFDYASSLQEYASTQGSDAAIKQMHSLHLANNADPQIFVDLACGHRSCITRDLLLDIEPLPEACTLHDFEKPIPEFTIHYLHVLKILLLDREPIPNEEKVIKLVDWMESEATFIAPVFILANLWFSPTSTKTPLDGRSKKAARRAAWDLAFIHNWRRHLASTDERPAIYAITRDKGLKNVARRLLANSAEELVGTTISAWAAKRKTGERIARHYDARLQAVSRQGNLRRRPSLDKIKEMSASYEKLLWGS